MPDMPDEYHFGGDRVMSDADALAAIHQALDGEEWSADTTVKIAEILVRTGRKVRTPGDHERNDMWRILDAMRTFVMDIRVEGLVQGKKRLLESIDLAEEVWLAMGIDNDDVPQLPLIPSPEDGPGCVRDARGRKFYSSKFL